MNLSLDLSFNGTNILVHILILMISFGIAWLTYRKPNPPITRRLKYFLLGLRVIVLAIVISALLEPLLSLIRRLTDEPVVAILVDESNSMTIEDQYIDPEGPKISRDEIATDILSDRKGLMDRLDEQAEVKTYRFAKNTDSAKKENFSGSRSESNIGQALQYVDQELVEQNLASIILLTDGANNAGNDPARIASTLRVPVFSIGIGDPEEQKDIAISRFLTNETAYVDNEIPVEVTVRSTGYDNIQVPLQIVWGDTVIAEENIILKGSSLEQKLMLRFVPTKAGDQKFSLKLPVQDGEMIAQNNVRDFVVKVLKNKIQVLHLAGRPSYDYGFLHRYMVRDPNVEPTGLVLKKDGSFYPVKKKDGETLQALPQTQEQLFKYDLLILSDLHQRYLGQKFEKMVANFVRERGGALLILGGEHSFQDGGYNNSVIADLMPVTLGPASNRMKTGTFSIQLTPAGNRHGLMQLDDDQELNNRIWQSLPPLLAYNQIKGIKPGAELFATFAGKKPAPAIALHRSGKGKVLAFMAATFWQWDFLMLGVQGSNEHSDRLWNNIIRYLVSRDDIERVNLNTDKKIYRSGESVNVAVQVYDQKFQPQSQAEVTVTIAKQGQQEIRQEVVLIEQEPGRYNGIIENLLPGDYTAKAVVKKGNIQLGADNRSFTVSEYSLEFENTRMNNALLKTMAKNSGGQYFTPANVNDIFASLNLNVRHRETSRDIILWDHPGLFILLILLLGIEWTMRKRRGLA